MKKYLLTGLIILLPLAITFMVFSFVLELLTNPFLGFISGFITKLEPMFPFLKSETFNIFIARILIIVLVIIAIFFLGIIARWFFINTLVHLTNKLFSKVPLVKTVYNTLKDIVHAFVSTNGRKTYKYPVQVRFPSKETYCIGFATGEVPEICQKKVSKKLIAIFVPTCPHPITGFTVLYPEDEVQKLDMTTEEALTHNISCGLINPFKEKHE
ncbi:MAG: DUF502 domain-containing protein [Chlamydiae bacterium]|nr:DUF502 domain-containing protein [Chlamydiota bacterium]